MTVLDQIMWVILPYVVMAIFLLGHVYHYMADRFSWTSKSSELLEKERLRWGSILFHYLILIVILGHFGGLVIPATVTASLGVSESQYHISALYFGGAAGAIAFVGLTILSSRRVINKPISLASSPTDLLVLALLTIVMILGLFNTLGRSQFFPHYDYRESISPWFRGVLLLQPDASLMVSLPFSFQLHILTALLLFAVWPFTRLVHVWTVPVTYLWRPYLAYRALRTHLKLDY